MSIFSDKDLQQLNSLAISKEEVAKQINNFENGFPYLEIQKAATVGDGIIKFGEEELDHLIDVFENNRSSINVIKFVPASGAASRMFKDLFAFYNAENPNIDDHPNVKKFFSGLKNFAFYNDLKEGNNETIGDGNNDAKVLQSILGQVLTNQGLNYGKLPKGLIKFHNYDAGARVAAEEHVVEGVSYGKSGQNNVSIHFTVSPEHLSLFKTCIENAVKQWPEINFDISYSEQKTATNTIAVDMNNQPFREEDGSILFRPGGHGALLSNLNDLKAEVIFIKNIDNVVPDKIKPTTTRYKNALAGLLISLRKKVANALSSLTTDASPDLMPAIKLLQSELNFLLPEDFHSKDEQGKKEFLIQKLNRPIRICGMVKNEGEPGGGPFWVKNEEGALSLQIVETSQIDLANAQQSGIVKEATHFNPVDLVCSTMDTDGKKFDLLDFRDPKTGFITEKSKDGKKLKAQELPGLWNGAMADWNTVFVEVPILTFNPVKTVNDLLRPQHQ